MSVQELLLTPQHAAALLNMNTRNRHLNQRRVDHFAKIIEAGEWMLTNDAIVVNGSILLNGQHRCAAIVKANIPAPVLLLEGVDIATQDVMDTGRPRQLGDVLAIRGETDAKDLAAAIRVLVRYKQKRLRFQGDNLLSNAAALRVLDENPGLRSGVTRARRLRKHIKIRPGIWGALIYVFSQIDDEDTDGFLEPIRTGLGLSETDPRFHLRQFLLNEMRSRAQTPAWLQAALVIKAWNAYRAGDEMRSLRFRSGGSNPEDFPEAR